MNVSMSAFFREDDLLTCKNQQITKQKQHKSTGQNTSQHFPCTDEAVQLIFGCKWNINNHK